MAIEIKELVVRLSVESNERITQRATEVDFNDQKLRSIVQSIIEEYIEKIERKEQR